MGSVRLLSGACAGIEAAVCERRLSFRVRPIQLNIPQDIAIGRGIHIDPRREEEAVDDHYHHRAMHEE
jgi:hypothetical protein